MRRRENATALAIAAIATMTAAGAAAAASCESLTGKTFGDASIVSANAVTPPFSVISLDPPAPVPVNAPFCRVQGTLKPSSDSDIKFEVWLPPTTAWNGKYQGVGNGGFAGSLIYSAMVRGLDAGYAVSATDTGHAGGSLDSLWALGHPEKIADFGWRAIHDTATASKAIVEAYYQKSPAHSYFSGCSDGGREALMEAQRFPKDYDGIVAGAPANAWTKLLTAAIWNEQALNAQPESWLSPDKLATITKAAVAACHGEKGVIANPAKCDFDPASLTCKGDATNECLTAPELTTLRKIYSGAQDSSGKPIFPGFAPGGEAGPTAWSLWITGSEPKRSAGSLIYAFGTGFYGNMVYDKPGWDFKTLDLAKGLADATAKTGESLNATETDLSAFKAAGGKLIEYHGWNDAAIPPASSIAYYESVGAKMGGLEGVRAFYRLFMAPGMEHCGGGPGPHAIGGVFGAPSPSRDPTHDVVSALAHWVEDGAAPNEIVAAQYRDGDPAKGVGEQRTWTAYPATAP
jgi:Tannase and feruloyl esterase